MDNLSKIPQTVRKVLTLYNEAGFEAYIVGGAARDIMLGKLPHDFDIASSATPDEGIALLTDAGVHTIDTSKKHGTIIAIVDDEQIEITTYRVESDYADTRHPDSVTFTRTIEEDVVRRDFTMNAIYIDANGMPVDLMGGIEDINNHIIRACGDPDKRFNEDALRILRALRFKATLGFEIDKLTNDAIWRNCELIRKLSKERIVSELLKLLNGTYACDVIREYLDIIDIFIPYMARMRGFDQKSVYHDKDLLEHTLAVVSGLEVKTDELLVAALLHDVGKPDVFTIGEDGHGHMKKHNLASVEIASRFLDEYKFPNAFKKKVLDLIYMHDMHPEKKSSIKKYIAEYSLEFFDELTVLQRADINAHSEFGRKRIEILKNREAIIEEILKVGECLSIKDLKINGSDVISCGVPKGPEVGNVLNSIFEKVLEGEVPNERDALLKLVGELINE